MLYAILAAVVSAACVFAPLVRALRLARLERPTEGAVLARISAAQSGDRRADWLWELDELTIEVDVATRAPSELGRSLSRASLASGTAFAVLTLANHPDLAHVPEAGAAFGAGVVGAACASHLGRLARRYSEEARNYWNSTARSVRKQIETGPRAPPPATESEAPP